jgi:hypothetical protein
MSASGCGAVLFTRAWVKRDSVADFDSWQAARHIPEIVEIPGIERAAYYATIETGLPQVFLGTGNRDALYWGRGLSGLLDGLTSPSLADAVADGSRFFPAFNELDGDIYTGNIYLVDPPLRDDEADPPAMLVERFEVTDDEAGAFERWLVDEHAPALRSLGATRSVRTGSAVRRDLPIPYYNSVGSHVVIVGLDDAPDSGSCADLAERLAESQRWDLTLSYVRREVGRLQFARPEGRGHG